MNHDVAPEVTLDQMRPTLSPVPDYEDPADADKVLTKVCEKIFCRELESWYLDVDVWPKDRSLKVFREWFDVQHHEIVEDVGRGGFRFATVEHPCVPGRRGCATCTIRWICLDSRETELAVGCACASWLARLRWGVRGSRRPRRATAS